MHRTIDDVAVYGSGPRTASRPTGTSSPSSRSSPDLTTAAATGIGPKSWRTTTTRIGFCLDAVRRLLQLPDLKPPGTSLKTITAARGLRRAGVLSLLLPALAQGHGTNAEPVQRVVALPGQAERRVPHRSGRRDLQLRFEGGWCAKVLDGVHGTCNDGEWATASLPTGWAKVTFRVEVGSDR